MIRKALVLLGLLLAPAALHAQTDVPLQSLRPTQGVCTAGSQSLRVCSNAFTACNDVCAARALDVNADIAGCATACCNQFNVCLRQRNCVGRIINCN